MPSTPEDETQQHSFLRRICSFAWCVLREFWSNNGLVLASAVAFNLFLSLIPLLALLLIALSLVFPQELLLDAITQNLKLFLSATMASSLLEQIKSLLANPGVLGWFGAPVLLFFGALSFSVTGRAMQQIFAFQEEKDIPSIGPSWLSLVLPYLYVLGVALGLFLWIIVFTLMRSIPSKTLQLFGIILSTGMLVDLILFLLSYFGLALLLASMYVFLPGSVLSYRRALYGGATAAFLWELIRPILVWYFTHLSLVNVIYGSLTTIVVVLLSFEIGAIVFLLGAQVIAELEKIAYQKQKS